MQSRHYIRGAVGLWVPKAETSSMCRTDSSKCAACCPPPCRGFCIALQSQACIRAHRYPFIFPCFCESIVIGISIGIRLLSRSRLCSLQGRKCSKPLCKEHKSARYRSHEAFSCFLHASAFVVCFCLRAREHLQVARDLCVIQSSMCDSSLFASCATDLFATCCV